MNSNLDKMVFKTILFFLPILMCGTIALGENNAEPYRTFTSKDGRVMEARFMRFEKDKINLLLKDGRRFTVAAEIFSPADQAYIDGLRIRLNPATGRPWVANDFKILLTKRKYWTDELKPGASKHLVNFSNDLFRPDKNALPKGKRGTHEFSYLYKRSRMNKGHWEVDAEGNVSTSFGNWKYDKKSGFLIGRCTSGGCRVIQPHLKQIEAGKN
jgi:hypothetical protein